MLLSLRSEHSKYTHSIVQVMIMRRMRTAEETRQGKMASWNFVLVYWTFCPIKSPAKEILLI